MATSTEEILIRMGIDSSGVRQGMEKAGATITGQISSIGRSIASAFSGAAALGYLNKVVDRFDDIKDRADTLGVGTDFLQGASQIARQDAVGGVESFNKSIAELSVRLGQAKDGSEEAAKRFQKFGISIGEISRLDSEGMFYLIADRIKSIPDPAQRAAAAFELLGKSGKGMVGVLSNGSEELRKMVAAVDKLDEKKVKDLAAAKDQIESVSNSATIWTGKIIGALTVELPTDLAKWSVGIGNFKKAMQEEVMQGAKLLSLRQQMEELDNASNAELEKARQLAEIEKEITKQRELQQKAAAESWKIGNKMISLMQGSMKLNFESPTIENLAGRDWSKSFRAMYAEGGQFDTGKGNGYLRLVAQDYIKAQEVQRYARTMGNMPMAEAARERMNQAESLLQKYGALPIDQAKDINAIRSQLAEMNEQLRDLTVTVKEVEE